MNTLETEMFSAGYCRSPNNPVQWYAAGPGIMKPPFPIEINVTDKIWLVARPYGEPVNVIGLMAFESVPSFLDFLKRYGKPSEGGMQGNDVTNVWD